MPILGEEQTVVSVNLILEEFIEYYRKYWIRITTPQNFSVFREERRINNDTERNNRSWHEFTGNHPRFVDFCGKILKLSFLKNDNYVNTVKPRLFELTVKPGSDNQKFG